MSSNNFEEFMIAVKRGDMTLVRQFYQNEWIDKKDDKGWQPIHLACALGHTAVVQLLLEKGFHMEAADKIGRRPIHWACRKGHVTVVQLLLDSGAEIEVDDKYGQRPIHFACRKGHYAVVQLLVDRGCVVNIQTKGGETPLDLSKQYNRDECVKIIEKAQKTAVIVLGEKQVEVHMQSSSRDIPLIDDCAIFPMMNISVISDSQTKVFDAARRNDLDMFQNNILPLWTKEHKTGPTLLDVIMQANAQSIIKSINCAPITDKDINDFLSLDRKEFANQSYNLLQQWLVHGCIRNNIDWAFFRLCCADVVNSSSLQDGTTCLDMAVEHRRTLCVQHILRKYVAPDDSWHRSRKEATKKEYNEILELIQHRQMVLQRNKTMGRTRLHLAVIEGDIDMVEFLLLKGLENHSQTDQNGDTPLMMAVANRMDECADVIKENGANVNVVNKCGQTIMHAVVASRMNTLPRWLISDPNKVNKEDSMGLTALQQAVVAGLEGISAQLVAINADFRSIIHVNWDSLRVANAIQKIKSLEQFELTSFENSSTLCLKLNGRIFSCFLNSFTRGDANFFDENMNSLLHLTALLMDAHGCRILLEKGALVGAVNKRGNTPLVELLAHLYHRRHDRGVDENALMTFQCLINGGADISDKHSDGASVADEHHNNAETADEYDDGADFTDEYDSNMDDADDDDSSVDTADDNDNRADIADDNDNRADVAVTNASSETALQMAIELLNEKMLIQVVRQSSSISRITSFIFEECLDMGMFGLLEEIVRKLSPRIAQEHITANIIRECLIREQHSTAKIFFIHARLELQEEVISEMLFNAACRNDIEYFSDILKLQKGNWKLMPTGESILTVLIRKEMWVFCEVLFETETASKLLELTDANGNSPLMVAIETDAEELIDRLIVDTSIVDYENNLGYTALSMLLENVSSATEARLNRLKLRIKQLIKLSADIHRVNKYNKTALSFCTSADLMREFETFQNNLSRPNRKRRAEEINLCGICMDRTVNRVLDDCGHTLCKECANAVVFCPFCRAPIKDRRRVLLP